MTGTLPTANVQYEGNLRTICMHVRSGNQVVTDAPVDNRGRGEAFSPTDLCATSLATCLLTIMGIKAMDNGWVLDGARAEVVKQMAESPRRISGIRLTISMPAGIDAKARQILERAGRTCPVALSLHPDIHQDITFVYPD
jgi:uncharacterized OsmC-like protein